MKDHFKLSDITVVGNTTWGQALSYLIQKKNKKVTILCRNLKETKNRANKIEDSQLLSEKILLSADTSEILTKSDLLILTFPSQTTRQNLQVLKPYISSKHKFLIASKGIEKSTGKRISEIILEELPNSKKENIAVISGPNLAKEIYNGKSTSSVIASNSTYLYEELRNIIESDNFKIYSSKDITGVELGGALKNVVTLGAGICDGLNLGNNLKGAFISIAFSEIVQIATKAGANPITISGLSGLGDTLASSYSPLSRNRSAGELIGKRDSIKSLKTKINNVIEGIDTLYGAKQLSNKISHDTQFIDLMIKVCTQQIDPINLIKNTIGEIE
ncbi:MAG: NAD(P)H-dependent glycerol-3-phosphate dehydrogenase [Dehalococcoidia bacterium]